MLSIAISAVITFLTFLCMTTNHFQLPKTFLTYREDAKFWRALTRKTFRISDQLLLQNVQWQWLYRKLLTQTRLYSWGGQVKERSLGGQKTGQFYRWPKQAMSDDCMGIVADVQCGGWSTTILTSGGAVYMVGLFDPRDGIRRPGVDSSLRRLEFPPAYPETKDTRYEPSTAIHQLSTGRSSALGLSDDGKVWMWQSNTAFQVRPMHVDLVQHRVQRVVAGWDRNSIYVENVGIVYWTAIRDSDILQGGQQEALAVADMMLIDSDTIPGTGLQTRKKKRSVMDSLEARIGKVINHIVLEQYIVFITDLDKVFCYSTRYPMPALDVGEPVELTTFRTASSTEPFRIRDLQGAFRRFAIFTYDGSVLTATHDLLHAFWNTADTTSNSSSQNLPIPTVIPSLQGNTTVSMAFGDHHFLALRRNGTVVAFGEELEQCGALGLDNYGPSRVNLRGVIRASGHRGSSRLPEGEGRTIWFEPLMATWLNDIWDKITLRGRGYELGALLKEGHEGARKACADYFEQEGAKWEENVTREDEIGAYFVLKVAAGGWSSAALVLVDKEKAEEARQAHIVQPLDDQSTQSRTLSVQSENSDETVDSPGEQLSKAVSGIFEWVRKLGRDFLGLTARDNRRARENKRGAYKASRDHAEYIWDEAPLPQIEVAGL